MKYIKQFLFFSVLGFILESIISLIMNNNYNSGILHGPYTPIYGIGVIIIIYGSNFIFKHLHLKRYQENFIVFGLLFFTISILELLGGIIIEKIFNKVFWSYKDLKFNYGNYISLEISFIWAFGGLIIYYLKKQLICISNKIPNIIYYILSFIFIIDLIYTFINI